MQETLVVLTASGLRLVDPETLSESPFAFKESANVTSKHCVTFDNALACTSLLTHHTVVQLSSAGTPVVTAGAFHAYASRKEKPTDKWHGHMQGVACLARAGARLVAGLRDGGLVEWELSTGDIRRVWQGLHVHPVVKVACGKDHLVSCSKDTLMAGGEQLVHHKHPLVDVHLGLQRVWSVDTEGHVAVWDLFDNSLLATLKTPHGVKCMCVNATETRCLVGTHEAIYELDLSGTVPPSAGEMLFRGPAEHMALSLFEALLYSAHGGTLTVWDCHTRAAIRTVDISQPILGIFAVSLVQPRAVKPAAAPLRRSPSENATPLHFAKQITPTEHARRAIVASIGREDDSVESVWQEKHAKLEAKYVELEALNAQLCKLVEQQRQ